MKNTTYSYLLYCLITACSSAGNQYPDKVESNLQKAGTNRPELEKAIMHFKDIGDSLKLKAAYFLIGNMDIHYSENYYWQDSKEKRIPFNEFDYPDFASAVAAMDSIKKAEGRLTFKDTILQDLTTLSGQYLIDNINFAVDHWKVSKFKDIPFNDFCEYILPYRVTTEPIQNWRQEYCNRYQWLSDSLENKPMETVLGYAGIDFKFWFDFNYGKHTREDGLTRLGAMHLLFRKQGACEDVAALEVFSLRSQSIPASYNIIPLWGTSFGAHFLNTVFDPTMKPLRFDVTRSPIVGHDLEREPAKVIRITYSKQPGTLASLIPPDGIPASFLRTENYKDITDEYWKTSDVRTELFPDFSDRTAVNTTTRKIIYACMFSLGRWQPAWWGKALNDSVVFSNIPDGTVILPMYYQKRILVPAGFPFVNGYNHKLLLKPDTLNRRNITIEEQDHYLKFRPGKKYRLYYWSTKWSLLEEKTTGDNPTKLVFKDTPRNALLLLVPEYSERKERPFIITGNGQRYWW
ncbi:MAG: hypothetical protein COC06_12430 [Bacteroidales bacterium]|nr:MAG: hypothetical protein COC06_12430 [Bacteroidales bacterium]